MKLVNICSSHYMTEIKYGIYNYIDIFSFGAFACFVDISLICPIL